MHAQLSLTDSSTIPFCFWPHWECQHFLCSCSRDLFSNSILFIFAFVNLSHSNSPQNCPHLWRILYSSSFQQSSDIILDLLFCLYDYVVLVVSFVRTCKLEQWLCCVDLSLVPFNCWKSIRREVLEVWATNAYLLLSFKNMKHLHPWFLILTSKTFLISLLILFRTRSRFQIICHQSCPL